jgi:hypothetical protein
MASRKQVVMGTGKASESTSIDNQMASSEQAVDQTFRSAAVSKDGSKNLQTGISNEHTRSN